MVARSPHERHHVLAWNAFRHLGPVLRFHPRPPPQSEHPGWAVWYGAWGPGVGLAVAFQIDRTIDRRSGRPYRIAVHAAAIGAGSGSRQRRSVGHSRGGIFAISTAPHVVTQRWARAVVEAFPDLDGVRYNSRFAGAACLALFSPARSSMPAQPLLSLPVTHPDLGVRLATAARRLGYQIV